MARETRRGAALIDSLAASLVVSVAVGGLFAAFTFGMSSIDATRRLDVATSLARADIEGAKEQGWLTLHFPVGAVVTYGTTTRDGQTVKTAQWSTALVYYSVSGAALSGLSPVASRRFSVVRAVTDVDVRRTLSGTDYTVSPTGERRIVTTVRDVKTGQTVLTFGTQLVRGGC